MADLDLARRAVAATGWRWMPGMRAFDAKGRPFRINAAHAGGGVLATLGEPGFSVIPMSRDAMACCLPDLDDPATVGCLMALVRERWGDPTATTQASLDGEWWMVTGQREPLCKATWNSTEDAALVTALEAPHG